MQPAERVLERRRGCLVDPLEVIHREEGRTARGEQPQRAQEADGNGAGVCRAAGRLRAQEGHLERVALRRRELVGDVVEGVTEDVAERRERELRLRRGARAREHAVPEPARLVDSGAPEGRLADPSLALDQEDTRAAV